MKKRIVIACMMAMTSLMMACGSTESGVSISEASGQIEENENIAENEVDETGAENGNAEDINITLSTTPNDTNQMRIEEIAGEICYNVEYDYEGDLGDIVSKYKDLCISKDDTCVNIRREPISDNNSVSYTVYSENGTMFTTPAYDNYPNSGEVFSFFDLDGDHMDEILVLNFVESTGGFVVTYADLFAVVDGNWKDVPIFTYEDGIINDEVNEKLNMDEGANGGIDQYFVRDILMSGEGLQILADKGMKDGAELILSYTIESFDYRDGEIIYKGKDAPLSGDYWTLDMKDSVN